jgi:hypothetical protein
MHDFDRLKRDICWGFFDSCILTYIDKDFRVIYLGLFGDTLWKMKLSSTTFVHHSIYVIYLEGRAKSRKY